MIFEILVPSLLDRLSKWFESTAPKTLTIDDKKEVAAGLREISTSIDRLSESTQNVADSIIDVKRDGDTLEAEGYLELAAKSLKAHVPDEAQKYLDKAQSLDSTNWALWFGYVNLHVIQQLASEMGKNLLNDKDIITLEKAVKFVGSTNDITHEQKSITIFTLLGVSLLYSDPTATRLTMQTFRSLLEEVPIEKFQNYLPIVRACEHIPICQQNSLDKFLHERARDWFKKEIDDALRNVDFYSLKDDIPEQAEEAIKRIDKALELGIGIISKMDINNAKTCKSLTERCVHARSLIELDQNPGCLFLISFIGWIAGTMIVIAKFEFDILWWLALSFLGTPFAVTPAMIFENRAKRKKMGLPKEYNPHVEFDKLRNEWYATCSHSKFKKAKH